MNNETPEIIVYRSPVEEWWWDNPEYIVWGFAIGAGIVAAFALYGWIKRKW